MSLTSLVVNASIGSPGAYKSTHEPVLLKTEMSASGVCDPTAIAYEDLEGLKSQALAPSLPADTITTAPRDLAYWIFVSKPMLGPVLPRDKLMTFLADVE